MEAIHRRSAARLASAILLFQRRCLRAMQEAARAGEAPAWQPAMLEDRIRVLEGRSQIYGTQIVPDSEGGRILVRSRIRRMSKSAAAASG